MKHETEALPGLEDLPSTNPTLPEMLVNLVDGPDERRQIREPIVKVWDRLVRIGHWLMVIFFSIIYLRYRKFPIHAYAGYLMLAMVMVRIAWGSPGRLLHVFAPSGFRPARLSVMPRMPFAAMLPATSATIRSAHWFHRTGKIHSSTPTRPLAT